MAEISIIGLGLDTTQLASGATRAVAALQQVEAAARQAQSVLATLGQAFQQQATSTGQLTTAAQAQTIQTHTLTAAVQSLTTGLASLTATQHQTVSALNQLTAAQQTQTAAQQAAIVAKQQAAAAQAAHRAQLQASAAATQQWQTILQGAQLALGAFGVQLGVSGLVQFGRAVIDTGTRMETLRTSLNTLSGGIQAGSQNFQFIQERAYRLGFGVQTLAADFNGLQAATRGTTLEGAKTRAIFDAVTTAARVMGSSHQQVHSALLALEQMVSKGTVSMEELRRQMGNAIPGAFEIAARAMGVSTQELNRMVRAGELMADEFLPRFGAQLQRELGGGVAAATQTAVTAFGRLESEWTNMLDRMARRGPLSIVKSVAGGIAAEMHKGTVEELEVEQRTMRRFGPTAEAASPAERERGMANTRAMMELERLQRNLPEGAPVAGMNVRRLEQQQADFDALKATLAARQRADVREGGGYDPELEIGEQRRTERETVANTVKRAREILATIPAELSSITRAAALSTTGFDDLDKKAQAIAKHVGEAMAVVAKLQPDQVPPALRADLTRYQLEAESLKRITAGQPASTRLDAMRTRIADEPDQAAQITKQAITEMERDLRRLEEGRARAMGGSAGGGAFSGLIEQSATRYGMDPALIRAMIQVESGFNPRAVSPKDARGLMQLMPGTARDLQVTDPFDPAQNIDAGTRYIAQQMQATGGNIPLALARYNTGPENVRKAGGIPDFPETRRYIAEVQAEQARIKAGGGVVPPGAEEAIKRYDAAIQPLVATLGRLRGEEKALSDAQKEAKKTSSPEQARGAVDAARETAAEQAAKDFEALTKLSAKYHESAAARDVDTAAKLRARLASSELYAEDARALALDVERMAALKDTLPLLREQAAASAQVWATDQRARGSLERYTEQFGLTPEGAPITPETRALVRMRRELAPLEGTEKEAEAKRAIARAEWDAAPMTRYARKVSDMAIGMFESIATGAKPSLEQLRNTIVKTLMDIVLDATNARAEMTKLLSTGVKAGIDWLGTALGLAKDGARVAGGVSGDPSGSGGAGFGGAAMPRQYGGPAYANAPYLVGEAGPEIFVPATNGTVLPYGQSAAQPIVINVYGATDAGSFVRASGQINRAIYQAQQGALRDS